MYYKIPGNTEDNNEGRDDIEILGLLTEPPEPIAGADASHPIPEVRTLGGLRLRYRYVPPSINGVQLQEVTWTINHRGRYCFDYGVDDPIGQCHIREAGIPYTQTDFQPEESASVYWEPLADAPPPPQLPGTPQVRWDLWAVKIPTMKV